MNGLRRMLATGLLATAAATANAAIVINFPDFSNCTTLQLNGNAACTANVLRVTPAAFGQSGSAFAQTIVPLGPGNAFSTYFAFRIANNFGSDGDGPGADGITFTVQPNSNTAGGSGGGIGYQGIPNSVAIEFDTWDNGLGFGDPNGNHVGVDLSGNIASVIAVPVATRLNDGNVWHAWIDYNGTVLELRLSQANSRPAAVTISHTVNLATVIGTTQAFVGFTSGTGAAYADHDILTWTFDNSYRPIGGAPAAAQIPTLSHAALAIVALLLAVFAGGRLRRH